MTKTKRNSLQRESAERQKRERDELSVSGASEAAKAVSEGDDETAERPCKRRNRFLEEEFETFNAARFFEIQRLKARNAPSAAATSVVDNAGPFLVEGLLLARLSPRVPGFYYADRDASSVTSSEFSLDEPIGNEPIRIVG